MTAARRPTVRMTNPVAVVKVPQVSGAQEAKRKETGRKQKQMLAAPDPNQSTNQSESNERSVPEKAAQPVPPVSDGDADSGHHRF